MYRKILKLLGLIKLYYYRMIGKNVSFGKGVFFHPKAKIYMNKKIGKIQFEDNVQIMSNVELKIEGNGSLKISKDSSILDYSFINVGKGAELLLKDHVFINRNGVIVCNNKIEIGDNVAIGPNVSMYDHDHIVRADLRQDWTKSKVGNIIIENDVWIAANTVILRNSHISHNSVIAAGLVVKGSIPENIIAYAKQSINYKKIN